MRLSVVLHLIFVVAFNGVRSVHGKLDTTRIELLEETNEPSFDPLPMPIQPTSIPSEAYISADGEGATCRDFGLYQNSAKQICSFEFCAGGSVTISQCPAGFNGVDYMGTNPNCNGDNGILKLYSAWDDMLLATDTLASGSCNCPEIVVTLNPGCQIYRVVQECNDPPCFGATAVFPTPPPDVDDIVGSVVNAGTGGVCAAFTIDTGVDEDTACYFEACSPFAITQCAGDGYTGDENNPPYGNSNNLIELYEVVDNGPDTFINVVATQGPCFAPRIDYDPMDTICRTYKVRQTCTNGATTCTGRTAIFTPPVTDDEVPPISVLPNAEDGVICAFFSFGGGGGGSGDDDLACFFQACGTFVVTQCPDQDYEGDINFPPYGGTDNYLELYEVVENNPDTVVNVDVTQGSGGCPKFEYVTSDTTCRNYKVRQSCINLAAGCTGRTVIYTPPVVVVPDIDAATGGLCDAYTINNNNNNHEGVFCEFSACPNDVVTISQCVSSTTYCLGDSSMTLMLNGAELATNNGVDCGCPKITYTFTEPCATYRVKQVCDPPASDCSGRTSILPSAIDDDDYANDVSSFSADGSGGLCDPYSLTSDGFQVCAFESCGGLVTISQCAAGYPGAGSPSCEGNSKLVLSLDGDILASDTTSGDCGGGCPEIVFTTDTLCRTYAIIQSCADGVNGCAGTTAVHTVATPPLELSIGGNILCAPFDVIDGYGAQTCEFTFCGGTVTVSQCLEDYPGSGGTPSCTGDIFMELWHAGSNLVWNQGGGVDAGICGCSKLVVEDLPYECRAYQLFQRCANDELNCAATTAVIAAVPPPIDLAVETYGALCEPFNIVNGAMQRTCKFTTCGGYVSISQCNDNYGGNSDSFGNPSCSANTTLSLGYEGDFFAFDQGSGPCGCPEIVYHFYDSCDTYEVLQTCDVGIDNCSGRTAVFPTPPVDAGSLGMGGGLCPPFAIENNEGEVSCQFYSCGGPVVISQCPEGYTGYGYGVPTCTGSTQLSVSFNGSVLSFDESTIGPCGCPELKYTLEKDVCQTYEVFQTCVDGVDDCSGTTAVFSGPPLPVNATEGGECPFPFNIYDGVGNTNCTFVACGGTVVISQCKADYPNESGFFFCAEQNGGVPTLELFLPGVGSLATNAGGGSCGCAEIVYTLPNTCQTYQVEQGCEAGQAYCGGRSAVFIIPAPSALPSVAPSAIPSTEPSVGPSATPSVGMADDPSAGPSAAPSAVPSASPSTEPSVGPSAAPAVAPPSAGPPLAGPPLAEPTTSPSLYGTVAHTFTVRNGFAFAVPTDAGDLFTLGEAPYGGLMDGDVNFNSFTSPVNYVVASRFAFVAVLSDQSYVTWGAASALAGAVPGRIRSVVANEAAFAGVNVTTGGAFAIGSKHNGGNVLNDTRCNGFATQLFSGVSSVVASSCSFTAIKNDGSVYTWGNTHCGGGISSETRTDLVNVQQVFATREAFAAILPGGVVKTWGGSFAGGDSTSVALVLSLAEIVGIFAGRSVFVAHSSAGGLIAWGYGPNGGDMSAVQSNLHSNVVHVAFTYRACAALKDDGDVYVWGRADSGGDASSVVGGLHNIVSVYGNSKAFAAVNTTGGVVTWGKAEFGGVIPTDKVAVLSKDVVEIFHTDRAFAALKENGQLVVWGQAGHGGSPGPAIEALLLNGVYRVYSNDVGFAVVKEDGSVVAWGHPVSVPAPGVQLQSELLAIR